MMGNYHVRFGGGLLEKCQHTTCAWQLASFLPDNTRTGYGNCYVCGTLLAKDICARLGIDPRDYGGLLKAEQVEVIRASPQAAVQIPKPPAPPQPPLESIGSIDLPKWLAEYVRWSSRIANQTPITFHLGMGLWMGAIAIARRLYVRAYWGQRIFPNIYMMFIAPTTYYRKTTALERGQDIIRESIPHMLMGTPGSPERFQDALAGQKPNNFDSLSHANQELINQGNQFGAQRGLLKDEVAGLFGSFKRDYMAGMKDFLLDVYECPDSLIKETQTGQMAVSNVYLSILGVTTPTGLMDSLKSYADWESGLLPRFLLLTPETDYRERPTPEAYIPHPEMLPAGLKMLHEALPMPEREEGHWQSAPPLQIDFEHWDAVKDYGDELRRLTDPHIDNGIDARLRGTYGRMHVQAIKVAQICAAFDWVDRGAQGTPSVSRENWETSKAIAEHFRLSAHRLLDELEEGHTARQERSNQDRVLDICKSQAAGVKLRDIYRTLGLTSAETRQSAQELCRAGLLEEIRMGRAEGYRYVTD